MKKIFLVYGHYNDKSFNAAIKDTFVKTAKEILKRPVTTFSDASFASTIRLESTTGSIVYVYGCPISWKHQVQKVRAKSTCDSEFIAQSDVLVISEGVHSLLEFLQTGNNKYESNPDVMGPLLCDNRSAVINIKKDSLYEINHH